MASFKIIRNIPLLLLLLTSLSPGSGCRSITKLYTDQKDFQEGTLINVVTGKKGTSLRLDDKVQTFDVMWVAASGLGTIVKIDTRTGKILGEYRTGPEGSNLNPSRTTVDKNGNVWTGNRDDNRYGMGSIVKIGLVENGQCVDRNGNGKIDTSTGLGDILPWKAGDEKGGVAHAEDECILQYVRVHGQGIRHLTVDRNNNVWTGGWGDHIFDVVDGKTGKILHTVHLPCGGYGGLIDDNDVLWSASHDTTLRYDTNKTLNDFSDDSWQCLNIDGSYGLGMDSTGLIWNSRYTRDTASHLEPDGHVIGTYNTHGSVPTGLCVGLDDDAWITNRYSATIARLDSNGTFKALVYVGGYPTGCATDAQGKIWVSVHDLDEFVRIDPATNKIDLTVKLRPYSRPYNYSDMTGSLLTGRPDYGTWSVVYDSAIPGALWDRINWNASTPSDANLTVFASVSEDGTHFSPEVQLHQNLPPALNGRYLKVSVRFSRASTGESPVLYDLRIGAQNGQCCRQDLFPSTRWQMQVSTCDLNDSAFSRFVLMSKEGDRLVVHSADSDVRNYYARLGYPTVSTLKLHRGQGFWMLAPENNRSYRLVGEEYTSKLPLEANKTYLVGFPRYHYVDLDQKFSKLPVHEIKRYDRGWSLWRPNHWESNLTTVPENGAFYLCCAKDFNLSFPNIPPVPVAKNLVGILGTPLTLDASGSYDPDGKIVSYRWIEGNQTLSDQARFVTDRFALGIHRLALIVTDDRNTSSGKEILVRILTPNKAPHVDLGKDRNLKETESLSLQPDAYDPDGYLVDYRWFLNGRIIGYTPYITLKDLPVGEHNLTLTVTDNRNASASDSMRIHVRPKPDKIPPIITLLGDNPYIMSTLQTYHEPGAMATDNRDGTLPVKIIGQVDDNKTGTYILEYQAVDHSGNRAIIKRTVIVQDPSKNKLPTVELGPDLRRTADQIIHLHADAFDPDGRIVHYRWKAPGASLPDSPDLYLRGLKPGIYKIQVVVTDNLGGKAADSLQLEIDKAGDRDTTPPTITILGDNPYFLPVNTRTYHDPGATAWDNRDGNVSVGTEYNISTSVPGVYVVTYTATDRSGNRARAQRSVIVRNPDQNRSAPDTQPPVITLLGDNPYILYLDERYNDPGAIAVDARDGRLNYSIRHNVNTHHIGSYRVIYTAKDRAGNTAQALRKVYVKDASGDKEPVALIQAPRQADINTTILFNGAGSYDPDGDVVSYEWREGDRLISQEPRLKKLFSSYGSHTLSLTVTDNDHLRNTAKVTVWIINPHDTTPPKALIDTPKENERISLRAEITGTAEDDHFDHYLLEIAPIDSDRFVTIAKGDTSVHHAHLGTLDATTLPNGIYTLRLRAFDENGAQSSATRTVIIEGKAKIGNFSFTVRDFDLKVAGIPVQVNRTYSTLQRFEKSDFTYGWSIDYQNVKLQESISPGKAWQATPDTLIGYCFKERKPHIVNITLPDGSTERFEFKFARECGHYFPGHFYDAPVLKALDGSTAKLQVLDAGSVVAMDGGGQLIDGSTLSLYNPSRYRLTLADGTSYDIDQHQGITQITTPRGDTLRYTRDGIISSRGAALRFKRDAQGRIISISDLSDRTVIYHYNQAGDLDFTRDYFHHKTRYHYYPGHLLKDFTDAGGVRVTKNIYDDAGRLIKTIDPDGNVVEFTHDIDGREEIVRDKLGRVHLYVYDDKGNVLSTTDPLGQTTTYTYDAKGRQLSVTDPLGHTTTNTYDAQGNLLSTTDALGHTETTVYNDKGSPTAITDKNGNMLRIAYDNYNAPTALTTPLGAVTRFSYDQFGNKSSLTNEYNRTTRYEYDAKFVPFLGKVSSKGNLLKETRPDGTVIEHTYDANGNMTGTKTTYPDGTVTTTSNTYDAFDRLISHTDERGNTESYAYDARGNKISKTDIYGLTTRYEYNKHNKLIKITYPDGSTESKSYDAMDNLLSKTDREGHTTRYEYDDADRLIKTIYPDGSTERREYDAAGRLTALTDANGHTTTYEYDAVGNKISQTDALGNKTAYTYDAQGNLLSTTDALGQTTRYEYNALNQRIKTIYPDGSFVEQRTNLSGLPAAKTDEAGHVTRYAYDTDRSIPLLHSVTLPNGAVTTYTYNPRGQKSATTDALGRVSGWEYTPTGELSAQILPDGKRATHTYSPKGLEVRRTDYAGKAQTFVYNRYKQLVRIEYSDGHTVTYDYTPAGKIARITDSDTGTVAYTYDERGRLKTRTSPDGETITYTYDAVGNITQIETPTQTITKTYDALNHLKSVTDNQGTTTYDYDAIGRQTKVTYPGGVSTSYTYDSRNRITSIVHKASDGTVLESFAYSYDSVGNRIKVVEDSGRTVSYTYNSVNQLTKEVVTNDPNGHNTTTTFTYDKVGNLVTKTIDGIQTDYAYNANDQLISKGSVTYTYDANGNLISDGTRTYSYDEQNRLIKVETPDKTIEYSYDAEGNRIAKMVNGEATTYLVDTNTPFAQVITESKSNGTEIHYTYGNDLLSDGTHNFLTDALGSTRGLVDSSETLTDSYAYTPYGELIHHEGTSDNSFLFTGEQFDSETQNYYLRARYYSPALTRFLSRDTYEGTIADPLSQNRYAYAQGNPVLFVDPGGHCFTMSGLSMRIATMGILAGGAITSLGILNNHRGEYGGNIFGVIASYEFKVLANDITIFSVVYMAGELTQEDIKTKQEEYDRYKKPCDNDPNINDFGGDYCAWLKAAIAHKKKCIELIEKWDQKWGNRHAQKIRDFKRTLRRLEKKLKKQGRICQ